MDDFNGVVFAKYPSQAERDSAIRKIQAAAMDFDGQKIWSKPEQPLKTRAAIGLLFAAKRMLVDWQFDKWSLWVDTDQLNLSCGDDMIFKIELQEHDLTIGYSPDWQTYLETDNAKWTEVVEAARTKVKKQQAQKATKGLGKGKAHTK